MQDNLFEQMANINKAHAFDIVSKQVSDIKEHLQVAYDNLIKLANNAYECSQNPAIKECDMAGDWYGKAEAYEYAATIIGSSCATSGIYLTTQKTIRQLEVSAARKEECEADAELKYHEIEE